MTSSSINNSQGVIEIKNNRISLASMMIYVYFVWYVTPLFRGLFDGFRYNMLFAALLLIGVFLMTTKYPKITIGVQSKMAFFSLLYIAFIAAMAILGKGDAVNYLKIVVSFFIPAIFANTFEKHKINVSLLTLIILLFFITALTSFGGLISNPLIIRTITYANTDENISRMLKIRNIGSVGFIQTVALCIPVLVYHIINSKKKALGVTVLIFSILLLFFASFATSIVIGLLFLAVSIIVFGKNPIIKAISVISIPIVIVLFNTDLLEQIIQYIDNPVLYRKFERIVSAIRGQDILLIGRRTILYSESINTFLSNPFGIGPHYSASNSSISGHSFILDALARYGFYSIVFFFAFFRIHYNYTLSKWNALMFYEKKLYYIIIIEYITFLFLNLGFRYEFESCFLFLLLPNLPVLLIKRNHL